MVTEAEKLVGEADEGLKKYKWQMQMSRVSADEQRKQDRKYSELERQMNEARQSYFKMEETVLLARQQNRKRITDANVDDNFIRSQNYSNLDQLVD